MLDQNYFIAQVNILYTNKISTRTNQLWVRGFANASSRLLFSRIFCRWMRENSLSHENRKGRHRLRWSFRVRRQCCSVSSDTVSHTVVWAQELDGTVYTGKAKYSRKGRVPLQRN